MLPDLLLLHMNKKITFLLVLFILADLAYSFYQHYYLPHDGDMAPIIVPGFWYADVLADPFGFNIVTEGKRYAGSNRFFAHWSLGAYFKTVPFLLQKVTGNMLDSTYLTSAVLRTALQILLVWLLGAFITGTGKFWKPKFILAAALVIPLFQMGGHFYRLSIIGESITYTFFYALSLAVVALFFLPFYRAYVLKQGFHLNMLQKILLAGLVLVIPFQGPLNFGVAAIIVPAVLLYFWWQAFKETRGNFFNRFLTAIFRIPKPVLFYFSALLLVSLYSYYIGTHNTENDVANLVPLGKRYPLLLWGLNEQLFFGKGMLYGPAYSILFLAILINVVLLLKKGGPEGKRVVQILKWAGILSVFYLALLPLGGYRTYRPYIVETSTFMPVTLVIFFSFGLSCWYVLRNLNFRLKNVYVGFLVIIAAIFSSAEQPNSVMFDCEREGIKKLAASKEKFVNLDTWCSVMSWGALTDPYISETRGQLLHYWGILNEDKTYVTRKDQ